ncbi:MAG: ketopantoate reductase family protein [Candidatus Hermodarchaeota archaeon]
MNIKNIWICGVGGVGGYFGGKIANKISELEKKNKIYFLARGLHLEEIKKKGLKLNTSNGEELICTPTLASDDIKDFPVPDLCLICVKSYDLDDLIIRIKKKLANNTIIIPLMNGIDIYDRIRKNLKKSIVLPTCVYIGSHIEKPGLIIQSGNPGFFFCGFDPKYPNFNPQNIIDFFNEMEINLNWRNDPYPKIWEKYVLVASFALVSAHTGQTLGGIIDDKNSLDILKKIMNEIVTIAERKGIKLAENIIEDIIEFCKDYPDVRTSYQRDIEKGKKNEGDLFGGALMRMGKETGIPTPMTTSIYKKIIN